MILSTDPKIKRPTIDISELAEEIKPASSPLRITRLSCVSIHQEKYIFRNSYVPQKNSFCQTSKYCHFLRNSRLHKRLLQILPSDPDTQNGYV